MLNSQTCMNSSTCAQVIWITSGQPSFIPVEERHPLLLTRRVKHAIDETKVCAPWRTLCVAGCMYATSVKKRVTRGLTVLLRLSFESIGDYTLWHSLSFNFGSQYLFFLPPRCTLGATKKWSSLQRGLDSLSKNLGLWIISFMSVPLRLVSPSTNHLI